MQSWQHWELIIIDDGSTDRTSEYIRAFDDERIQLYSDGTNLGLATRLNEAVKRSQGEYFARMDGDDIAYPERLTRQLSYLEKHPDVDMVGSWVLVFDSDGGVTGVRQLPELHDVICRAPHAGFMIVHPTFMGKKSWFDRFTYDRRLIKAQDQALLAESFPDSRFANVQEVLLAYREDMPSLRKLLSSRWFVIRGVGLVLLNHGKWRLAMMNVLNQCMKMVADILLSCFALRSWQLARRSGGISESEKRKWLELCHKVDCKFQDTRGCHEKH